ncbi:RNA polymerase sigma factor RpoD/SigA [Saccharopolyspora sp. NFXS83]|uniref:sigma-70 family RNA polymerase sigma factor n=1 Tax=Saccharopolyspora sp. NFXS83 TaxID=2993560 RepID=UPI00224B06CF|nr:RNA polymerase sigma factor RpoD/SigA [Saccharopolyspora sp. NFXS83]MCX2729418.1 RNA polymerase sigma factor RpoD/SigA [Saccharopolyspora sp. NFXS83]
MRVQDLLPLDLKRRGVVGYFPYVRDLWKTVLGSQPDGFSHYDLELHEFQAQLGHRSSKPAPHEQLLIIQGQQLPGDFYDLLRMLGIRATVFVDPAAVVSDQESTITEIGQALGVSNPSVMVDVDIPNAATHAFTAHFHTGSAESRGKTPDRTGNRPVLLRHEDHEAEVGFVVDYAKVHSGSTIGLLLPDSDQMIRFRTDLRPYLGNRLQWYLSNRSTPDKQVSLRAPGVKILTWSSAAGMRFDRVILPSLHFAPEAQLERALNVLGATASDELVLSYSGPGEPTALKSLPQHLLDERTSGDALGDSSAVPEHQQQVPERSPRPRSAADAARAVLLADRRSKQHRRRVLTAEEEVGFAQLMRGEELELSRELPQRFRAGLRDEDERAAAFDAMLTHNDGLLRTTTRKWSVRSFDEDDLYQYGVLGLFRAIEKFNASMGTKFSTYATQWINQSVQRAIPDEGLMIRVPVHMWDLVRRVEAVRNSLVRAGLAASPREIADRTELPVSKVVECLRLAAGVHSLDVPVGDEDGTTLGDLSRPKGDEEQSPDAVFDRHEAASLVRSAMARLTDREAEVLRLRFGFDGDEGLTLDRIGDRFSLTRERIRQIETKAQRKLARHLADVGVAAGSAVEGTELYPGAKSVTSLHATPPVQPQPGVGTFHELACGTDLIARLGTSYNCSDSVALVRELAERAIAAGASAISIRTGVGRAGPRLVFAHDGPPFAGDALRTALTRRTAGKVNRSPEAKTLGAAITLFDEVQVWDHGRRSNPYCLLLTHAPRTGTWWLRSGTGRPPAVLPIPGRTTGECHVVSFQAPRRGASRAGATSLAAAFEYQLGLVLGDLLRERRLVASVDGHEVVHRHPFLWNNPAAQDLGTEPVTAGGHSVLVNPRVLPHPDVLRDGDEAAVGPPHTWQEMQGFYVRCEGRYVSCSGWLGLDGLASDADTSLARIVVDITSAEAAGWRLDSGRPITPPAPLRPRLTALAMLTRRRSALVLARRQEEPR